MKRAVDLKPPEPSDETTNKQCKRVGRYLINGKYYCKYHAGQMALQILMGEER